jgi:hypothetical protein
MRQPRRSLASNWLTGGALLLAACNGGSPATPHPTPVDAAGPALPYSGLTVYATAANTQVTRRFFEFLPEARATVVTNEDPASAATADTGANVHVALLTDLSCGECYRLSGSGLSYEVHGGNALGAQYGLAQLLEELGFRFFHPWGSKSPTTLNLPTASKNIGPKFTPDMTRRGLHLHTLHPIESYFTFWASNPNNGGGSPDAGGESPLDGARRVIDWIVKNRGNYVEWSALNDIVSDDADTLTAWRSHTSAIIAYAHARGIKIGIATELFGEGNLQLSFDLLDDENDPNPKTSIDARWHLLTDGLAWDTVDISFGEFSGTDPNVFLANLNLAYDELEVIAPGTELAATVHVGNEPSLEVTYDGQTLLYYFLVKYADPHIVPWIHSVMYFDLFQSVDGAYNMPSFDQHRAYLESRMMAGQPVAYYPESAYWIAFDDSVPTYLPVYMRSRWLDQTNLAGAAARGGYGGLKESVLFSSGWEWGYWQNDYAVLRMNWKTPTAWTDSVSEMFAPWGVQGAQLAAEIGALGELESKYLIDEALAAYFASQDELITLGAIGGIVSQPPRTTFPELAAMSTKDRASFKTTVLAPLARLDAGMRAVQTAVAGLNLDPTDPWLAETTDGIDIDAARVHFIRSLYEAVAAFEDSGSDDGWLAKADTAWASAGTIVKRRDAHLHYPRPKQITGAVTNSTFYQSGYLTEAATLCYWTRERTQARAIVLHDETAAPGCVP